ncbi:3-oxoacyl-[acyl-carrier-protein] reductase [Purpureocillium takamizusanense]|uniref:3-oxoacyl-[acyl-carrier-protein] reductase n=1 Tax=Purpureocillium takamizusanense TaxID=2060973 RepID=A0A9Q8VFV1_9HYPO|nr:3-oxoacyl-[acyl-carrier-protein] reductase [Purpureocillium takamizusanense]UNI23841.1 3-oxoacyl-[acyl-carrier-protein] reductase [Purpureocillium takamizusanense]
MADRIAQLATHLNYPRGLLAGQVAIVTGSGQGIGAETARLFANEGAKVVVADIDAVKAQAVADSITSSGGQALAVPGDILQASYVDALVSRAASFGGGKIHIIVNNAGYTWDGVIHKTTDAQWETIIALHCTAPFRLVRAASPYFRVQDGEPRAIVNISSTSGVHGNAGQINYALAKAGVTGMTKTIAKEWGPRFGVRCNAVAFGHIETRLTAAKEDGAFVVGPGGEKIPLGIPQRQRDAKKGGGAADGKEDKKAAAPTFPDIPLGRPGSATEAAASILAVASPLFSYVTGQTIMVTGGRNM